MRRAATLHSWSVVLLFSILSSLIPPTTPGAAAAPLTLPPTPNSAIPATTPLPISQPAPFVPIDSAPPPLPNPPPPSIPAHAAIGSSTPLSATIPAAFSALPLAFVPNVGQTQDRHVQFQAHHAGGTLFFRPDSLVLALSSRVSHGSPPKGYQAHRQSPDDDTTMFVGAPIIFQLDGANRQAVPHAADPLPGVVNYYTDPDSKNWHEGVPTFAKLIYDDVYPGIDLLYDGSAGSLKSTYVVAPGVDPQVIRWRYKGVAHARIDAKGNIHYSDTLTRTL